MNKYLSEKLKIISLISMLMVIFLHSYNLPEKFNSIDIKFKNIYDINIFLQTFLSQGIIRTAVPIFFTISGYLFFLNFKGEINEFIIKYKKRIKSLVIPFLLWSIWGLLFLLFLQLFPFTKNFFKENLIINYSFEKILNTIFIKPIPYQLWFIRDLIVLVFISPLIYWILKILKFSAIIVLLIIWIDIFNFNLIIFSNEAILFFCLGSYLSISDSNFLLKKLNKKIYLTIFCLWILIVTFKSILICQNSDQILLIKLLHKFSIIIGMLALWSMYDIIMSKKTPNKTILYVSQYSFFLYAFHEPLLMILQNGLLHMTGKNDFFSILIYIIAPIIIIISGIIIASFMRKYLFKFYELITGTR